MSPYLSARIFWALRQLPRRFGRLARAVVGLRPTTLRGVSRREWSWRHLPLHFVIKCVEIPLLLAECLLLTDLFAVATIAFRRSAFRALLPREQHLGEAYYGQQIDWSLLRCCDSSRIARKRGIAFVVLNTVYFDKSLPDDVWVHELMHVYQYQRYGATYIPRALQAQRTHEGYNYGTFTTFSHLTELNAEQQAELMQDYCRRKLGLKPNQTNNTQDLAAYETVLQAVWRT